MNLGGNDRRETKEDSWKINWSTNRQKLVIWLEYPGIEKLKIQKI